MIDSGVDTAWVRERIKEREGAEARRQPRARPADAARGSIAETYWQLHQQPRDAWTLELDLRPFGEKW